MRYIPHTPEEIRSLYTHFMDTLAGYGHRLITRECKDGTGCLEQAIGLLPGILAQVNFVFTPLKIKDHLRNAKTVYLVFTEIHTI